MQDNLDLFMELKGFFQDYDPSIEVDIIDAMIGPSQPELEGRPDQLSNIISTHMVQPSNDVWKTKGPFKENTILQSGSTFYNCSLLFNNKWNIAQS